jgi:DNA repair photolyase
MATVLNLTADPRRLKGRGAASNSSGRFERERRWLLDDGWREPGGDEVSQLRTQILRDTSRSIITRNTSPDISFDQSINPYRGCEHGCIYCFARPSHAYLGLSPGIDFESRILVKPEAARLLRAELSAPGYMPRVIAIGTNTDPYQPLERNLKIMRQILEVLMEFQHPVAIVTKSALVLRDRDLLGAMAREGLVKVALSITTLDPSLARSLEPRAATPARRLEALKALSAEGIPTGVMFAPVIPALNDSELETILGAAAKAGARSAGYVLLRLPLEVKDLFREWLEQHAPARARHVLSLIRAMRSGKDYDANWHDRMTGSGPYARMIAQRFHLTARRLGLNQRPVILNPGRFRRPPHRGEQLSLL